jgi:hypothetical protein
MLEDAKKEVQRGKNIDESATYTDCELEFIGEGYEPRWAAEICANEEGRRSDEEKEKSSMDKCWEYWLG